MFWSGAIKGHYGKGMAVKGWCKLALFGVVLFAFFQFDSGFRRWEARALATSLQFARDRVDGVLGMLGFAGRKAAHQERCSRDPSDSGQASSASVAGDSSPSSPSVAKRVASSAAVVCAESYQGDFPGAGWYCVQAWEGMHPHPHARLSQLDGLRHVHIASEDEWWSWSFGVCPAPQFPDGHAGMWTMVSTDGVRHDTLIGCQAAGEAICAR